MKRRAWCAAIVAALLCAHSFAQENVPLIPASDPTAAWKFDNGQEFPGATGSLAVDAEAKREGHASLKLTGDFTKGGNYVQAGRAIDRVDIRELSMWLLSPDLKRFTLRLIDATDQTHQIDLKVDASPDWQRVAFPLERFFAKRGEADAVTNVAKYESWGGAKDSMWHGPATAIYFLIGKTAEKNQVALWLNDVSISARPREVPGAEIKATIALDEIAEGAHDWKFTRGEEYPGAKGSLDVAEKKWLRLAGDFTGGGAYVAMVKDLKDLEVKDVNAIRMRVKSDNAAFVGVQLVDGSGQTHQQSRTKITPDGKWNDLVLVPEKIAGGEHWGGANDGKWHGPPRQIALSVSAGADEKAKQPVVLFGDIRAEALLSAFAQPPAFKSAAPIVLSRTLENIERPASATTPAFKVAPGQWEISLATKAALYSPDNSYNGVVQLECLDVAGKTIERFTIADVFGEHDRQAATKRVEFPTGAATARFQVQLNKTYGTFSVVDLSAAFLAASPRKDGRIARLLFSTAQLGNLLFPNDPRRVNVTVETTKPLRDNQRNLSWMVRDYWGAEQMRPATIPLEALEKKDACFLYQTDIDLRDVPLEIGRYYELHAEIPQENEEPFRNYTSFAILPEAATKKFKPEDVPFTSRNWDNRLEDYVRLSDRLGVRVCGIWGGWSSKPPYAAEAPSLDLAQKLGMGWLTNTPAATIEAGKTDYDEEALRTGVRNMIEKFGKMRPMFINLGNEPHGTGDRVLKNVAAYRTIYEEVKRVDPSIPVIATSVEPNEEYFKAGYGKWCDAFDFHIYETADDVRRTMGEYRTLMKKYGVEKPLWSTELGLNSVGQTRHTVAVELIKKTATFFAGGGEKMSWFGFLYPDADGKAHGNSGDSHNVFDCRFNHYAPRLDAIAYYNAVNAVGVKKFVAEKQYDGGVSAFLFCNREGHSLQVLWKNKNRADVSVPLKGVKDVAIIRIDGTRRALNAGGNALTLSIGEDPLLLLYDSGESTLPEKLGEPVVRLEAARGEANTFTFNLTGGGGADLLAPTFWKVKKVGGGNALTFTATAPPGTEAREADFTFTLAERHGELYFRAPLTD